MRKREFYEKIDVTHLSKDDLRRVKVMLKFIKNLKIKKLIDIGCIPKMTEIIANFLNCSAIGINISKKVINSYKGKNRNLRFIRGDIEKLNLKEKFDLIICGELIEHLSDVDNFIIKISKILNDNGYLLLTTPNLASLFNRLSLLFGWQPRGINPSRKILLNPFVKYDYNFGHVSMFTYHSIKKFLSENGFEILKMKGVHGGHERENKYKKILRWIMSFKTSFSEQLVILARLVK